MATVLGQLVLFAIIARHFDATQIGYCAIVVLVGQLTDLLIDGGFSNATIHFERATAAQRRALSRLNIATSIFVCAVVSLSAHLFADPDLALLLYTLSPAFLFSALGQQSRASLEKGLRFARISTCETIGVVVYVTTGVTLTLFGTGPIAIPIALVAGVFVRNLGYVTASSGGLTRGRPDWSGSKPMIKFGAWSSLDVIVNFAGANIGIVAVAHNVSAAALGRFNLAYNLAVVTPGRVNPVFNRVFFPALSSIGKDNERVRRGFATLLAAVAFINVPVLVLLATNSEAFISLFYGDQWRSIALSLQILCMVGIGRALANPIGALILATNLVRVGLYINVIKTLLLITATWFVTALYGVVALCWVLLLFQALNLVVNFFIARKATGMSAAQYCEPLAGAALIGTLTGATVLGLRTVFGSTMGDIAQLAVSGFATFVLMTIFMLFYPGKSLQQVRNAAVSLLRSGYGRLA